MDGSDAGGGDGALDARELRLASVSPENVGVRGCEARGESEIRCGRLLIAFPFARVDCNRQRVCRVRLGLCDRV